MDSNKGNHVVRSVLVGIGVTVIYLTAGLALDYVVTQLLSQFVVANCSEDCYFKYFNSIFVLVALLSVAGGIRSGLRSYKRLSEK